MYLVLHIKRGGGSSCLIIGRCGLDTMKNGPLSQLNKKLATHLTLQYKTDNDGDWGVYEGEG